MKTYLDIINEGKILGREYDGVVYFDPALYWGDKRYRELLHERHIYCDIDTNTGRITPKQRKREEPKPPCGLSERQYYGDLKHINTFELVMVIILGGLIGLKLFGWLIYGY